MQSAYHYMYRVLIGDKGAYEVFHQRQAYSFLCQELQELADPGRPAISIEVQDTACDFVRQHGTRVTKRYANALWRARQGRS